MVHALGTTEAAAELGLDASTVRRRRSGASLREWSAAELVTLMVVQRDTHHAGRSAIADALARALYEPRAEATGIGAVLVHAVQERVGSMGGLTAQLMAAIQDGSIDAAEAAAALPGLAEVLASLTGLHQQLQAQAQAGGHADA